MPIPEWLDPRRIYQNPKRLLNPLGMRGGLLYGSISDTIGEQLNLPGPVRGAMQGALSAPTPLLMPVAALIGADLYNPVNAGEDEKLRKIHEENERLLARGIQPGTESMEVRPGTVVGRDGATATLSETPPPAPKLPPPAYEPPTPEILTVLAKLKGRPGVLNKETGEFTQQPWSSTEAERYARYRAPASEEVVVTPSEDQVVEDLKAELLETALTGVGPSEGYESFQSQRLGDAIRQAQEDIIRRRVESGDLMYR